jgi:hypothetical protein
MFADSQLSRRFQFQTTNKPIHILNTAGSCKHGYWDLAVNTPSEYKGRMTGSIRSVFHGEQDSWLLDVDMICEMVERMWRREVSPKSEQFSNELTGRTSEDIQWSGCVCPLKLKQESVSPMRSFSI